jgi:hypothetical protein
MKEVARRIRVPETTYREWEYGRTIRGEPYVRIAETLGVSVHELLTGKRSGHREILRNLDGAEARLRRLRIQLQSFF